MENKTINLSNRLYPIFCGFSGDLMFWTAINTLFLTTVKHLTASQINTIEFFGTFTSVFVQLFSINFIRKIGNKNSIKLGTIMLFFAAFLFTVSHEYYWFFVAQILYCCGFIFKQMDNVILIKNLKYIGKQDEYIKYQARGSLLYSIITLIISIFSGVLFNINHYIPMIMCILICLINIVISNLFYEVDCNADMEIKTNKYNFRFSTLLILIMMLYGLFFASISVGQTNSKLFIQLDMSEFLSTEKIAIYLSILFTISRIVRTLSDLLFIKICNILKHKIIKLLQFSLFNAFFLMLIGHFLSNRIVGITIMALGFFLFLAIRDPFDNYMKKICLESCDEKNQDKAVVYLTLSRKFGEVLFSAIVAIILTKFNYIYVISFMMIVSIIYIFIINKIHSLMKCND